MTRIAYLRTFHCIYWKRVEFFACASKAARAGDSTPQVRIATEEQPIYLTTVPSGRVRANPANSPKILLSGTSINMILRSLQSAVINFL